MNLGLFHVIFCDWKATTVDETLLLLTVEFNGKRNKSACTSCFARMYPDFDSRVHLYNMEGNEQ